MLFNSLNFLLFFPTVCIIYYILPTCKQRNLFLLAASYFFYMNWQPIYALLLFGSTIVTWLAAIKMNSSQTLVTKKCILTICVVLNLSVLFIFKYYNFATDIITGMWQNSDIALSMPQFTLLLPIGISFYMLQAIGYSIDVYRENVPVEKNFFTYALFVSFFPQLVAGPIERSSHLVSQFKQKHTFDYGEAMVGIRMMVWGYFLKLVLADRCALYVDAVFNNVEHHNGGSFLVASLLFTFQIYGDFAGYSLIAIGTARILGFRLLKNFSRPYFSTSITDFWHRWHISLSSWLKDYVYIPLGGSHKGVFRNYTNLLITFGVSGLWHGANWTYIIWGLWHGLAICFNKSLNVAKFSFCKSKFAHWAITFGVVCFGWIFFRATTLTDAYIIIKGIFVDFGVPYMENAQFYAIALAIVILIFKEAKDEFRWNIHIADSSVWFIQHLYLSFMILYILALGVLNSSQFIYFQF